ncbi:MAG: amidohydrolase [Gammaproteobacteria bacterium]|nr:amidohydrolase [Gammaproteobacteria bacterium]
MNPLTVTLIQADLCWQDPVANRELIHDSIRSVGTPGHLIVLPEMFTTGFTMDATTVAETMAGETVQWLQRMAADLGAVITGSLVIRDGERYFNRLLWVPPDGSVGHYDKRHLFRMANEQDHYAAGQKREVFRLGEWRICPLICYDLRFPVWSRGVDEFELLLYVANWPAARRSAWTTLLPARAVENLCYVAGVNRVGTDGNGRDYAGDSGAWDHLGRPVAQAGDQECVISAELDGDALLRYRQKFPAQLDADTFELRV